MWPISHSPPRPKPSRSPRFGLPWSVTERALAQQRAQRASRVEVWLGLPFLPVQDVVRLAVAAERLGVHGVAASEHVCVPAEVGSSYPYNGGKAAVLPPSTEFADPLVLLSAIASVSSTLRLTTHVLVLPLRHPVLVAKEVATLA